MIIKCTCGETKDFTVYETTVKEQTYSPLKGEWYLDNVEVLEIKCVDIYCNECKTEQTLKNVCINDLALEDWKVEL